jgi:hypothetical protein
MRNWTSFNESEWDGFDGFGFVLVFLGFLAGDFFFAFFRMFMVFYGVGSV